MLISQDKRICGIGLVVEHVLAKDETGVRYSYPAHKTQSSDMLVFGLLCFNAVGESKDGGGIQDEWNECVSPSRGRENFWYKNYL